MDFLVQLDTSGVLALPAAERGELIKREQERGLELMAEGVIKHLWSRVGQYGNVGIWAAEDADGLQAALASLPIRPYVQIEVTPLATHPLTAQATAQAG
jgi:muconolactone D-isomerase